MAHEHTIFATWDGGGRKTMIELSFFFPKFSIAFLINAQ